LDQIARRIDESEIKDGEDKQKLKYAYLTPDMEEPVYLHDSCVLRQVPFFTHPRFVRKFFYP
jgi:hypothetical protein